MIKVQRWYFGDFGYAPMIDHSPQNYKQVQTSRNRDLEKAAASIAATISEPLLVLDKEHRILAFSQSFREKFHFSNVDFQHKIFEVENDILDPGKLEDLLTHKLRQEEPIKEFSVGAEENYVTVNAAQIDQGTSGILILLNFKVNEPSQPHFEEQAGYKKLLIEILSRAPAMLCTLRGPQHVFELANDKYLQLVGNREIIGKTVKEALPEVENQGFINILDRVYRKGKPFVGNEVPVKLYRGNELSDSLVDFVFQPIRNAKQEVDGIFVHAIDVSERVFNRKKLEESEAELRNLIDAVPVIIRITDVEGQSSYLNKNWYDYTGQEEKAGLKSGWLEAIHPEERVRVEAGFKNAVSEEKDFQIGYRLRSADGDYRCMMDRSRPRFSAEGRFQGLVSSIVDVHEDKLKEKVIREKEHRLRSIVEEATVATAVYTGLDMKVELANDAMLELWGKGRNVVGKNLKEVLPELEGQPFHDLLRNVFLTGKTYWGNEDQVDLMIDGQLQTGYFNFTYKPLRNEKGEIYGILNMAIDVSENVNSKLLLKEREKHFRQMADLMPEKVTNSDPNGKAVYFNQNWLDYTQMSSEELQDEGWENLIHPGDRKDFDAKWSESLESGSHFEKELRIRNGEGAYLWHLSRAEAVKDDGGMITMWINTNTEIQRLKEEEKRKEDFLKMVSHELKTPVTSMKGYVQLLLTLLKTTKSQELLNMPFKPSLERIDHQIVRLTRLISEMLDLSRIEEQKLELQKTNFEINDLVVETVQDIGYTNTNHKIKIINTCKCEVYADKDRIGQVLINLIVNAIKYSPESHELEVKVEKAEGGRVAVKVRDFGIGIAETDQERIFERFYRIGGQNKETYAGFGIGLYVSREIIHRHGGKIDVKSTMGKGSEFSFTLAAGKSEEN